jgi:hypothetical protein
MKKIIFTIILFTSIISLSFAQLELKPAIGINASRFDSDLHLVSSSDSLIAEGRAGYQVGVSLAIGRRVYIEPGVFYNKMNQSFTPANTEKSAFTYSAGFIRIPVNFGWQFIGTSSSFAGLRVFIGPSMFIPLTVKENTFGMVKEDIKSPQFDIAIGAGLNIWFLFLDVSYGWGLTPQFNDDSIEAKMQSLYVNLGFRFKLKKDEE